MAQVKFKYESVRSARHTIRGLLSAVTYLTKKYSDNENAKAVYVACKSAQGALNGQRMSQEKQVERLTESREWIIEALKASTELSSDFKDGTSHEKNAVAEIADLLTKAKEHTTCARQWAKDRRFVSKWDAPVSDKPFYGSGLQTNSADSAVVTNASDFTPCSDPDCDECNEQS